MHPFAKCAFALAIVAPFTIACEQQDRVVGRWAASDATFDFTRDGTWLMTPSQPNFLVPGMSGKWSKTEAGGYILVSNPLPFGNTVTLTAEFSGNDLIIDMMGAKIRVTRGDAKSVEVVRAQEPTPSGKTSEPLAPTASELEAARLSAEAAVREADAAAKEATEVAESIFQQLSKEFRRNADGSVTVLSTGLQFSAEMVEGDSFGAILDSCAALVSGGQSDWRLPTRDEFLSIMSSTGSRYQVKDTPDNRIWSGRFEHNPGGKYKSFLVDSMSAVGSGEYFRSSELASQRGMITAPIFGVVIAQQGGGISEGITYSSAGYYNASNLRVPWRDGNKGAICVRNESKPAPKVSATSNGGAVSQQPYLKGVTWLKRPGAREFDKYYPPRAADLKQDGRVVLNCFVQVGGSLECQVGSESPMEWGFGEAALMVAKSFQIAPLTVDGTPTTARRLQVPIRFTLAPINP
jgi:TonB family protein